MSQSKLSVAWKFYLHLLKYTPIQTKTATAMVLSYCGNVITQKVFEKNPRMDHKRALKFVTYYLILMPIAHYWYKFLDRLFEQKKKEKTDKKQNALVDSTVLKKVALDELLFDPFCVVFFFTVISLLEGKNLNQIVEKVKKEYWITQKMSWRIWPLVQLINFAVVPGELRLLFINMVSFFWGIFLQIRAGKN